MRKKWLFLTLLVIILFGIGGVVLWKFPKKDNSVNQPIPQPHPDPPGKLSQAELEKYLLEKRLDLQKYFVFNLGKEVKDIKTEASNWKLVSENLANDFTKLTSHYKKLLEKKGDYNLTNNERRRKIAICFLGNTFKDFDDEYDADKLNEKIKNGENKWIVFEKDDDFHFVYFQEKEGGIDENGKQKVNWDKLIRLRIKSPTVYVKDKRGALELIKTDPALIGKV